MVGQSEIGDASKVKVFGKGLIEGHTFEVAEFIVDTRSAGKWYSWICGIHYALNPKVHFSFDVNAFQSILHLIAIIRKFHPCP